ncbi:uncharacterized protein LOC119112560 [Pollicipes pollicipes]|uniref:uncharacterized protein LOC119112560 n=1 Tax=Pollicipes pollicipes TaxID=41117 RepID=UPI0018854D10|nr:uncharacterized protein LOC119112560 [Pollicipes pollicipes]
MVPQSINFTAEERERNVTCEIGSEAERSEQCTTVVRIIVDILQIKDVNEEFGIVRLLMVLRQFWSDGRLDLAPEYRDTCPYIQEVNNGSAGYVPSEAHRKVWVPDLYLIRVEEVYRPEILAAAETFRVDEHGNVTMHSPSTSYIKAIDVWMFVCLLFVFAAVVDCLIDIRLLFVVSQSYKQERLGFLTPVSVALVENRRVFDDLFGGLDDEPAATPSVFFDAPSRPELPWQKRCG